MERIGRWALIIKSKIRETEELCEDLKQSGLSCFLFGRNKIVPPGRVGTQK
jgi:hypothetical protein